VWTREEEFFLDTFRPASVTTIRAGLDASRKMVLWDYRTIAAGDRGAAQFYDVPHQRTVAAGDWSGNAGGLHPFAIGPWRAPGNSSNTFARESHVDQLASTIGCDPVEFRLANLSDGRMTRVLRTVATRFGWSPMAAPSGRGWGVALGSDAGTCVAAIAEVRVDRATGRVDVVRVVGVQDMGLVVNPDGARQQMEGCIAQGLGYALSEEIRFAGGRVLDTNFDTYDDARVAGSSAARRRRARDHRDGRGRRERGVRRGRRPAAADALHAQARAGRPSRADAHGFTLSRVAPLVGQSLL